MKKCFFGGEIMMLLSESTFSFDPLLALFSLSPSQSILVYGEINNSPTALRCAGRGNSLAVCLSCLADLRISNRRAERAASSCCKP